ncbi:PREDICTED: uncharacterized protein LOC104604409 [Nelumbo nucifera]|uniref:Uncharacterized protein LOC104604409 n=2 Tax=Nelumbo nucifera TaxID=4432 RepID=A0A1U8AIK3_NELNU|nr:PREDICTED: uncharacterized protein LOC104604409 [Nelumbo nucifera]DAD48944.1 TPA_asm: hypothetical protein HUJ06_018881 [Nelumbo nucifera]
MDVVAVESFSGGKSPDFGPLIGHNYEIMLKESVDRFLDECRKGISDVSGFGSVFFRLLQARVDPPIEVIWFYSAVSFRGGNLDGLDPLSRVLMVKDLFQLLTACSASCNGLKSVAVLAPVLFELHQVIVGSSEKKQSLKTEKKLTREIDCLIEGIVGYISICCSKDSDEEDASVSLLPCFTDLIRVWMTDQPEGNRDSREILRLFFPLSSQEIRQELGDGGCMVGNLAGVVIAEAFLLRLSLKFRTGISRAELQNELKSWAVGSVTGFRNCYFFETLVRMLLERTLPVTSILGTEDESFLRRVLYDVVVLVEYSFLNTDSGIHLPAFRMKTLAVARLLVANEAIQGARENGDHAKAISYINAYTRSRLPSELVKCVSGQVGIDEKKSGSDFSTPQTLIKWLLKLDDQGAKVFDHYISKMHMKLRLEISKVENEALLWNPGSDKVEDDLFFYIDSKGEKKGEDEEKAGGDQEMIESMDASLLAAAHTMKFTENDRRRKRKEGRQTEGETRVKFVKYHLHDDSIREKPSPFTDYDSPSSASEVEDPQSDEDVEMEE